MAELHHGTTLRPSKHELLTSWIGSQRWYAAKGSTPQLTRLAAWRLDDPAGEVGIETHVVRDTGGPEPVTYQVPVTYRGAPEPSLSHALIGTMEHGVLGQRWVYDAVHDPVYAEQLLALIRGQVRAESSSESDSVDDNVQGEPASTWTEEMTFGDARALSGEQSNSSIIIDAATAAGAPRPVIIKVFRMLSAGDNPDVVLQSALLESGCTYVPAAVGAVRATWPTGTAEATGHLAFAQEFISGSEDAWRVALRAATGGTDFTCAAGELGEATAAVHTVLAAALPTQETTADDIARLIDVMHRRLQAASELVPEIAARARDIEAVFEAAERSTWPPLQRIHGDYHLGQVLHSGERGWLLLDFEGEPLRPLTERILPDSTFRDLAGMVRSLDYAGGSAEQGNPARSAREWVDACVTAFLDGYSRAAPDPRDHDALLRAFLLDKALYEVVYEARNRPDWLAIPASAIDRLLDPAGSGRREPPTPQGGSLS